MLSPARSPEHALRRAFPSTGCLPSTISAAEFQSALFEASTVLRSRPTPRLFRGSFVSSTSCRGPGSRKRLRARRGLPGSDATRSSVMWSQTPAGFRGSIPHPKRSLCTFRRGRHLEIAGAEAVATAEGLPRRNTRYQAGAAPFPDRTFTGWTAPASPGAPLLLHRSGLAPPTPCRSPGALRVSRPPGPVGARHPDLAIDAQDFRHLGLEKPITLLQVVTHPRPACSVPKDLRDGVRLWQAVHLVQDRLMQAQRQVVPIVNGREPRAGVATTAGVAVSRREWPVDAPGRPS